ncbi:MAG: GDSL-type esterase/lipase family protein [Lachnospiraceae bacterium]|nr:GDSL-type esterase/lipase family protein [Lachnospiraceae bacterium]
MEKINKFLLMVIAMMVIMVAAVGIDKGLKQIEAQKWEKERVARYEQARAEVNDMQLTISELSKDQEAIEAFIEENKAYFDEEDFWSEFEEELFFDENGEVDVSGNEGMKLPDSMETDVSGNMEMDISGNDGIGVSGNSLEDVSGNNKMDVSGNMGHDVSGNGGDVSGNEGMDVSGNTGTDVSGNMEVSVSGNEPGGMPNSEIMSVSGNTLADKRKIRGSYMETQMQNDTDQSVIEGSTCDFSDVSIACLGDSITQASNLENMEDYQQYAYPTKLKEILGAESVTNLGIGGSSIGRYWDNAFVDRYKEIPKDTDLIIVMGGTNDGFCLTQEELGTVKERKPKTFIGDLDELMRGLKADYPDATIVFATPLPNVLHDMLKKERDYLLPQIILVNAIKYLAKEYEIPVIDLYNSNILDTHDAAVIYNYMPDGVHCNPSGYTILAEHFAAELIKIYEQENNNG